MLFLRFDSMLPFLKSNFSHKLKFGSNSTQTDVLNTGMFSNLSHKSSFLNRLKPAQEKN